VSSGHEGFHLGHSPWTVALTVTLATFMEVLDTSIANVSLPHIAGGLSATVDESTWVLTSYLVSNAVVLPISAWMAHRYGRKRFYMTCVALFTISSFLCGIAPNLGALIFCRVLQGVGGGGLAPSEQAILTDTFPVKKLGSAFAVYGMAVVLAPAIGPTLGGYITDNIGWRWIFFINVPVGILSLFLTHRIVEDPPYLVASMKQKPRVDWPGLGLVALGLGFLQVVLDKGQEEDWFASSFIRTGTIVSVTALVLLVVWDGFFEQAPVIDFRLFRHRNFAIGTLLLAMVGMTLFGSTVLLPEFVQLHLGYSAEQAGMVLSPGALIVILLLPLVGFLISRVSARWVIGAGFLILALALFRMTALNLGIDFLTAVIWRIYQAAGIAFLFIPINTAAYVGIAQEQSNQVSSLMNLARNLGGSVGISFVTALIARRTQFHHAMLGEHLLSSGAPSTQDAARQAQAILSHTLDRQAGTLAFIDAFWILAVLAALMIPVAFLLESAPLGGRPVGAH
jgi:DHA2 family multidrug resistance protein